MNIFLPAAGLGERLRPVTNHLPKPLLPILGKPIIEGILERLTATCQGRIGINLHWKPDLIRAWAATSPWAERILFFPEDPILGTGGALKNAEAFLSTGPFIVHNADILLDIDFSRLLDVHRSSGNIATLVCHRLPELSNVVIDAQGQVLDVENPGASRPDPFTTADKVAYTGVAVYSPEILQYLPTGVSHMTVAWVASSRAGKRVRVHDVTGSSWNDIGNPATYARAVLDALCESGEMVHVSPSARCGKVGADGYVVIESGSDVRGNARIRNCIVMPGAAVADAHENQIIGPDYTVALNESDMQPAFHAGLQKQADLAEPVFAHHFSIRGRTSLLTDAVLIGLGGSDRRYYRIKHGNRTAVLMECGPNDPDYPRHMAYSRFFEQHAMPVPGVFSSDEVTRRALFEDLGDLSLYSYLKLPHPKEEIERIYQAVLDILVRLHTTVTEHIADCPLLRERMFDLEHLRWETHYFLERFVTGLTGTQIQDSASLNRELDDLARTVDAFPRTIIHRDFQCQNIMLSKTGMPRIIDFQGARMAPPAYDVASMLWDPYYRLHDDVRSALLAYYESEMSKSSTAFDEDLFRKSLLPCRLQRHMQALGAYGFLSMVKGKKYFLKHIPEALRLLRMEADLAKDRYPVLSKLVSTLQS